MASGFARAVFRVPCKVRAMEGGGEGGGEGRGRARTGEKRQIWRQKPPTLSSGSGFLPSPWFEWWSGVALASSPISKGMAEYFRVAPSVSGDWERMGGQMLGAMIFLLALFFTRGSAELLSRGDE